MKTKNLVWTVRKGGAGSGNWGHAGRPGERGGSGAGGGSRWAWNDGSIHASHTKLSLEEQAAVVSYGAPEFGVPDAVTSQDINDYLRHGTLNGSNSKSQVTNAISLLDQAEKGSVLDKPITLYRGLARDIFPAGSPKGIEFQDHGFVTGSGDPNMAKDFPLQSDERGIYYNTGSTHDPVLRISVPAGASALDHTAIPPANMEGNDPYTEYILPRGSTFRITGATHEKTDNGRPIWNAEVVTNG